MPLDRRGFALGCVNELFTHEDIDLTFRLHLSGQRLVGVSPMPVVHRYSASERIDRLWLQARNRAYFLLKCLPRRQAAMLPLNDIRWLFGSENISRWLRCTRAQRGAAAPVLQDERQRLNSPGAMLRSALSLAARTGASLLLCCAALPVVAAAAARAKRVPAHLTADLLQSVRQVGGPR